MKTYKSFCPRCERKKDGISQYFCIKNRGYCEQCFIERNNYKKKNVDEFAKWRPKNLLVDKDLVGEVNVI